MGDQVYDERERERACDRVRDLEVLLRAEQGYTSLNEARIAELEAEKMAIAQHDCAQVLANDRLLLVIEGLTAENRRLQTENDILLREKVRWILGGGE